MFINKSAEGANNICGAAVARLRKAAGISQRELADRLQLAGLDIDKNAVQRIECGKRFVTDIEIVVLAKVFAVGVGELLGTEK
ncbi:MAG: helix-turn-helix transcriptional regulator [Clostridia bacterium]|nr:helix-turn-helix transcriptional regulator [Clostridia bacterium]